LDRQEGSEVGRAAGGGVEYLSDAEDVILLKEAGG
jgi:hypothetical protein